MRAKAVFAGHPLHPMLIPFPIVFLVSAFVCDIVGRLFNSNEWWTVGGWLVPAGIISALVAASAGFIDYLFAVPPKSSGKKRATKHMISNLAAVTLFLIAWLMRGAAQVPPTATVLALEAVGTILLGVGGWLGGTLVYKNLIGVEHRYAQHGHWEEKSIAAKEGEPVIVGMADDLKVDQMKLLKINGRRIVLSRSETGYEAFDDRCSHRGGSLADGVAICGSVQCMWHGSQFNRANGSVRCGPAQNPIASYRVEQVNGQIRLIF